MTRWRVTDRATGEVLTVPQPPGADPEMPNDSPPGPTLSEPLPGERPIVGPSPTPPSARGRVAVEVLLAGWRFDLEVEDDARATLREQATSGHEAATHHGPTDVRAIIPGRVVAISVAEGDAVTAGQRLLAVEAMKMENELRAPRNGTVERIVVAVGQTVELGDPLVVIR